MAIGFRLSNVLDMSLAEDEEFTLDFTTKSIRYRITFDDSGLRKSLIKYLNNMKDPEVAPKKKVPEVKFYNDESKFGKM